MQLLYLMLMLSSLVLPEDEPALGAEIVGEEASTGTPQAVPEGLKQLQFCETAFCWKCAFLWVLQIPWGFRLLGAAALLLCLALHVWSMSCKSPGRKGVSLEAEAQREPDLRLQRLKRTACGYGTQTTYTESYGPAGSYGPSSVTPSDRGSWNGPEVAFQSNYQTTWPPMPRSVASQRTPRSVASQRTPCSVASQRTPSSFTSFTSFASSSSSSLYSSLCLAFLKPLGLRPPPESPSSTEDSPDTSSDSSPDSPSATELVPSAFPRRAGPAPCPEVGDSSGAKEKAESTTLDLLQCTQRPLGAEMLPALLEEAGPHPLASFAQINILQSYKKEDQIVLVAKSLAIRLGPAEEAQSSLPPQPPPPAQEEEAAAVKVEEKAEAKEALSFMKEKSLDLIDDNIRQKNVQADSLQSLQDSIRRGILRAASQGSVDTLAGSQADLLPPPGAQDSLGEVDRQLLELHVKKKMIQRRFGVPSVVMASLKLSQALTSPFLRERSAGSGHAPHPEQALSSSSTPAAPSAQPLRRASRKRRYSISDSIAPEEIQQLAFHATVKMLEVQLGAFPDLVERSFRLSEILSADGLPKPILLGNKTERLKHPSLPFLAQEALSIIDLNVSHKCLLNTRTLSALDLKAAVMACQEPADRKGGSVQRVPSVATGTPRGAEPGPALGELPGYSPPPPQAPTMPPSPPEPPGPKDHTTEEESEELRFSPTQPSLAAPVPELGEAAQPTSTALVVVPKLQGAPCPFLLPPLAKGESPGPFPSALVLQLPSGPSESRGPEDADTVAVRQKPGASRQVQFQDATIPGLALDFCSWVTPRTPCPSLSSLGTSATSCSSEARGLEEEASKEASQNVDISQQEPVQEASIPGEEGPLSTPGSQDSSASATPRTPGPSLSSLLTSATSSSSEARGPEEEASKEASQNVDISQQEPVQEATIPGEEGPLSAPGPQDSSASAIPRTSSSSSSLLVSTAISSFIALGRPEAATTKDRSPKPAASQAGRFQQATVSGLGPGVQGLPPGPETPKPSASPLATAKALRAPPFAMPPLGSSLPRRSEEEATKRPRVSQEATLHRAALPEPRPKDKAATPGSGTRVEGGAKADGKRTAAEKGAGADGKGALPEPWVEGDGNGREESKSWQEEEERPVTRTSILLELELKKEKLNLHLKKRLAAPLLPQQRAALELSVDVDRPPCSRKAKRATPQPAPSASSGPEAQGKPSRPFCYVCMPLDDTGSVVKTVCWDLPRWILDMNGHRVPQVARFEKRPKGPQAP